MKRIILIVMVLNMLLLIGIAGGAGYFYMNEWKPQREKLTELDLKIENQRKVLGYIEGNQPDDWRSNDDIYQEVQDIQMTLDEFPDFSWEFSSIKRDISSMQFDISSISSDVRSIRIWQ